MLRRIRRRKYKIRLHSTSLKEKYAIKPKKNAKFSMINFKNQFVFKGKLRRWLHLRNIPEAQGWLVSDVLRNPITQIKPTKEEFLFQQMLKMISLHAIQGMKRRTRAVSKIRKKKKKEKTATLGGTLRMLVARRFKFPIIPLFIKQMLPQYRNFPFKWSFEFSFKKKTFRIFRRPQYYTRKLLNEPNSLKDYIPKVKKELNKRLAKLYAERRMVRLAAYPGRKQLELDKIRTILNFELFVSKLLEVKDKFTGMKMTKEQIENIINYSTRKLTAFFSFHTVKNNI